MEWVAIGVAVVAGLALLAGLAAGVVVAFFVVRRLSGGGGPSRDEMLADLGFKPIRPKGWSRPFQGTQIVFTDAPSTWTIRLPRYNTLTLQVEERAAGRPVEIGRAFTADEAAIDERFVLSSELAARSVALVRTPEVARALLDVPGVSLKLRADELVLGSSAPLGATDQERDLHERVARLATAVFGTMYAKATGTVMDEFR